MQNLQGEVSFSRKPTNLKKLGNDPKKSLDRLEEELFNNTGSLIKLDKRYVPMLRLTSSSSNKIFTFSGYDLQSSPEQMIKVIIFVKGSHDSSTRILRNEKDAYDKLIKMADGEGVIRLPINANVALPRLLADNVRKSFEGLKTEFMVFELFENLLSIHRRNSRAMKGGPRYSGFPIAHLLKLAVGCLQLLQFFHSRGLIHTKIMPGTIMLKGSLDTDDYVLFITHFHYMKRFQDRSGRHVLKRFLPRTNDHDIASYCTANAEERSFSRKDDLEQLALMLIDLRHSTLPWLGAKSKPLKEMQDIMHEHRINQPMDLFIKKCLPNCFKDFLVYTRSLAFEQEPDYQLWISKFEEALKSTKP